MSIADDLWKRLSEYSPDDPQAHISFSARLGRENGWNTAYTRRIVEEYRRFLYLVCMAGHEVTPSEEVDAAWHLHLVHTRSYWDDLCGAVLQRPVHHGPTKGGGKERVRFGDAYEKTLASYARLFGENPPADIWPPQSERFAKTGRMRWIDTGRNWVIAKPARRWRMISLTGFTALVLVLAGLSTAWASSSGKSPDIFGVLMIVGFGGVLAWRGGRWLLMSEEERAAERAKKKGDSGGCSSSGCSSSDSSSDSSGDSSSGGCSGGCGGGSSD